ncbi:carbohydrate porin [Alkalilimnicola sp. S0819]|uniref:carbohydrate porin n=1 Tax=Alkalilimnicola sp. S0819 TaxID=2613922 RepID=UPI0012620473|nr:carbohydrate porin [Alkalilimnicola sp. S0819]KAB7628277.1 carbohydrate porin [Alkalilimnicola sp. S0819]MPQ15173.1 carbohydrate porin [Alkalilimnicola sp. S0819]
MPTNTTHTLARLTLLAALFPLAAPGAQDTDDGIKVGGAVRFQSSWESFDEGNRNRGGDLDLDTVRLNFDGTVRGVILSAELRYYEYMEVVHHAWVGYDFSESLRGELGITQVPFGNLPFNSHGFFFSTNYYLGLEDDYDAGLKLSWRQGPWTAQAAFFKNDERGGEGGDTERYSYDIVAGALDSQGNLVNEIGESNTLVGRLSHSFGADTALRAELGISALGGQLHDSDDQVGDYHAAAVHLNADYGRWNLQLQATRYEYSLDADNDEVLVLGAFAFPYRTPGEGLSLTANLAYRLPVNWGPVDALTFYSDNSLLTDKPDGLEDTVMNALGIAMEIGPVLAYLDLISAKNQPFIGGELAGDSNEREERVNFNVGYYF